MLNNHVDALGDVIFYDYSHAFSETQTDAEPKTLAKSGETIAHAEAEAFAYSLDLSGLYTESSGFGDYGAFKGTATSETEVIANFSVAAGETFSFDFLTDLSLEAKEIDNPDVEYSEAFLNMGFLILDTTDPNESNILDYADISASLISSEQIGDLNVNFSNNFTLDDYDDRIDIDKDNGLDFIDSTNLGTYQRTFDNDTNLTLVKVNNSVVEWLGYSFIYNLGPDFIYGTIEDDHLFGTRQDDKLYASFGDDFLIGRGGNDLFKAEDGSDIVNGGRGSDRIFGGDGDDILVGGNGNDRIFGGDGDDILIGSNGDDLLAGGRGNDILTGGLGSDRFVYETSQAFQANQLGIDHISDFAVNSDSIVLSNTTFTALTITTDGLINPDEFEIVASDELASISEAFITYSTDTGNLFYNQNGSDDGLGQGSQFATLQNIPTLNATNFSIIE